MNRTSHSQAVMLAAVFLACLAGGFLTAQAWQTRPTASELPEPTRVLAGWLRLLPDQAARVANVDPQYSAELAALEAELQRERETLATMFEADDADDAAILAQVERVIAAHDRVERRVAQYLVGIRPYLSPEQRKRLFQTCADGIRQVGGHRWRHGRQDAARGAQASDWRGRGRGGRGRGGFDGTTTRNFETSSQPSSSDSGEQP